MKTQSITMAFKISCAGSLSLNLRKPHVIHNDARVRGFNYPARNWQHIFPQSYPVSLDGLRISG